MHAPVQRDVQVVQQCLYFDDIGKQPNDEGAFYAVLQDEQGVTHVNWWQP